MTSQEILQAVSFPVGLRDISYRDVDGPGFSNYYPIKDRKVVVRLDTGAALSVVSDQYKLMPYADATEPLLEKIEEFGGSLTVRDRGRRKDPVRLEAEGRRLWIEAQFQGGLEVKIGKDIIRPRIVYGNSYDGSTSLRAIVGFYQVICTNAGALMKAGLVKGFGGGSFNRKHHGAEDVPHESMGEHLRVFLEGFGERAETLRGLANSEVIGVDAERLFKEHCGDRAFAAKYPGGAFPESAWAFYSRVTNYLTIDFKGGQQPMEQRAAKALADVLRVMR